MRIAVSIFLALIFLEFCYPSVILKPLYWCFGIAIALLAVLLSSVFSINKGNEEDQENKEAGD